MLGDVGGRTEAGERERERGQIHHPVEGNCLAVAEVEGTQRVETSEASSSFFFFLSFIELSPLVQDNDKSKKKKKRVWWGRAELALRLVNLYICISMRIEQNRETRYGGLEADSLYTYTPVYKNE